MPYYRHCRSLGFTLLALGIATAALGSATSQDFVPCHQQAGLTLTSCMNQSAASEQTACWKAAKTAMASCYAKVQASYRPMGQAERQAKARAEAAMQRQQALEQARPPAKE